MNYCKFSEKLEWEDGPAVICDNGVCSNCGFNPIVANTRLEKRGLSKEFIMELNEISKNNSWLKENENV